LLKYRDQQLAHLGSIESNSGPRPGYPTENVGSSTIYGAEVEVDYLVTDTTKLSLHANYVHAKYDSFIYQAPDLSVLLGLPAGAVPATTACPTTLTGTTYTIDCSGFKAYQVPALTFSGGIQQTFELINGGSFVAEIRSRYESSRFLSETFLPESRAGSNTLTNANLTYNAPDKRWSVTAYVNNIEKKDVLSNTILSDTAPFFGGLSGTLRPPRTYGLRGRFNF
jgi:iron complex outermembrane recepter protein